MAVKEIYKLVIAGGTAQQEHVLRTPTNLVTQIDDHVLSVVQDLKDTLRADKICVGLSANQIGENLAICVINVNKDQDEKHDIVLINPQVIRTSGKKREYDESCMSVPDYHGIVERREKVQIEFNDQQGDGYETKFEGFIARVVQHEIDHLNGIMYTDKLANNATLKKFEEEEAEK